jgi:hypothetical protein
MYSGCNLTISTTNIGKVIRKYGIFKFEEDLNIYSWLVPTPLKLSYPINPLPYKFKQHLPLFIGDVTITTKEHLRAFSNACTIIRVNDNDNCMLLFKNSL